MRSLGQGGEAPRPGPLLGPTANHPRTSIMIMIIMRIVMIIVTIVIMSLLVMID